jgi:hypothetical protein
MFLEDFWLFNTSDLSWTWISGAGADNKPVGRGYCSYGPIGTFSYRED